MLTALCLSACVGATSPLNAVTVSSAPELLTAIRQAQPGHLIRLAPGRYRTPLRFTAENSGSSEAPVTITARDGPNTVVIDGAGSEITVKFNGARYIKLQTLDITGGGKHGVFFDNGAHDISVDGNRIYDNHADRPLNSHAEVKGSGRKNRGTRKITISRNEIFHNTHPPGGNFQGIDCNFCEAYRIADNYLHDIRRPTIELHSRYDRGSCIQMKSGSRNTIIERNRIERCHIGIVFGGEGLSSPEHIGGSVRNNLISDSAEIGIAVVNAVDGDISHNTVVGEAEAIRVAADGRFPDGKTDINIANNILNRAIHRETGQSISANANIVVGSEKTHDLFRDAAQGDYRLKRSAATAIDRAAVIPKPVRVDFSRTPRPYGAAADIGAFEYRPNEE